jgi:hypothetical protein
MILLVKLSFIHKHNACILELKSNQTDQFCLQLSKQIFSGKSQNLNNAEILNFQALFQATKSTSQASLPRTYLIYLAAHEHVYSNERYQTETLSCYLENKELPTK